MKTYTIPGEGRTIDVFDTAVVSSTVFKITEGPFEGVWFTLDNMVMDEHDDTLMHYNVQCSGATVDEIKPFIDNFILSILIAQINRDKNDQPTDLPSDPDSGRDDS